MGYVSRVTDPNGHWMSMQLVEGTLTAGSDGADTDESDFEVAGEVIRTEVKATTLKSGAYVKGYESDALNAVGSRGDFCNVAGAGTAVAKEVYPWVAKTDITGTAVSNEYGAPVVHGKITMALSGANENEVVTYRVYIQ